MAGDPSPFACAARIVVCLCCRHIAEGIASRPRDNTDVEFMNIKYMN
ncbi:hypothetical protein SS05631_d64570 (plasmid) [Sinorhizobium sp. CCBAU 05631]|nr:hypothetical protein SS05631_d64570 [Sinorhizobium sp. CCBAU 05631]